MVLKGVIGIGDQLLMGPSSTGDFTLGALVGRFRRIIS